MNKKRSKKSEKQVCIILILAFLFISVVSAQNQTAIDKGYACLTTEVNSRISTITPEELSFSLLALSYNFSMLPLVRDELIARGQANECWPSGSCSLRNTALAVLALDNAGEDTTAAANWLSAANATPSGLEWFLQVDPDNATTCTLTYDGTPYSISVRDDKTLSGGAGSCLPLDPAGYWLQISSACQNREFSISCGYDFRTTLLYKLDSTIYVSDTTHSAPNGGTTQEKISILCFAESGACNYEGSAWAAYALQKTGRDTSAFIPYIIAFADSNRQYFPEAFLYLLTAKSDYRTSVSSKQSSSGYWDIVSPYDVYNVFYDTALALLSLYPSIPTSASNYLLNPSVQGSDGCWNNENVRDTAFVLYSAWPKAPISPPAVTISVIPAYITLMPNATYNFSANVTGTSQTDVVWSINDTNGGTINASGFYTAPNITGIFMIIAALQSNQSKNASAVVTISTTPPEQISVSISPSSVTLLRNQTQQFTVSVTGTTNTAVTWNISESNGGIITSSGLYTAPNITGTFNVVAVSQANPSKNATATITIINQTTTQSVFCEEVGAFCLSITQTQCTNASGSVLDYYCSSSRVCCTQNVTVVPDKTCSQLNGEVCPTTKICPSEKILNSKDVSFGKCCQKNGCTLPPQTCSQLKGIECQEEETCKASRVLNASDVGYGVCCKSEGDCAVKTCSQLGGAKCTGTKVCDGDEIEGASDIRAGEECCDGTCVDARNECEKQGFGCRTGCDIDEEEAKDYSGTCDTGKLCCQPKAGKFPWIVVIIAVLIVLVVLGILFREKIRMLLFKFKGKGRTGPAPPASRPPFPPMFPPARPMPRMITRQPQAQPAPVFRAPAAARQTSPQTDKELDETFKKLREMSK